MGVLLHQNGILVENALGTGVIIRERSGGSTPFEKS